MRLFSTLRVFMCRESGVSFIETMVTLAILGTIAVTFLTGVVITSEAAFTTDEQATAESLAQSQMEWAQSANYTDNATGYTPPQPDDELYANYSANITVGSVPGSGAGIQKITVIVKRSEEQVITLETYKVNR